MNRTFGLVILAGTLIATATFGGEVTVKTVKYPELANLVRSLKGKVVLVDFWRHD